MIEPNLHGHAGQEERKFLLTGARDDNAALLASKGYGSISQTSPRICFVFNDSYLGGQRSAWLSKVRAAGFCVEQTSANLVAIAAPDEMLQSLAIQRGSHGQHTMPATPERSLHVLLSEFDPSLAAFLEVPGPFSNRSRKARLSEEVSGRREVGSLLRPEHILIFTMQLEACGLIGWFWLHNVESAATIAPKYVWSGCFGLSREPLGKVRNYFGTEISWNLLYMNFVARWMVIPAMGSAAYSYVRRSDM